MLFYIYLYTPYSMHCPMCMYAPLCLLFLRIYFIYFGLRLFFESNNGLTFFLPFLLYSQMAGRGFLSIKKSRASR